MVLRTTTIFHADHCFWTRSTVSGAYLVSGICFWTLRAHVSWIMRCFLSETSLLLRFRGAEALFQRLCAVVVVPGRTSTWAHDTGVGFPMDDEWSIDFGPH